jgi:hypothetical protein
MNSYNELVKYVGNHITDNDTIRDEMVREVIKKRCELFYGDLECINFISENYGVSRQIGEQILKLIVKYYNSVEIDDIKLIKSTAVMRLEKMLQESVKKYGVASKLSLEIIKEIHKVQGLYSIRLEADDSDNVFNIQYVTRGETKTIEHDDRD